MRRPVTREEAAARVGISRKLAAFHPDKLVEVGLLRASFTPVGGIRRVGRTPKTYEPTDTAVPISILARHPELLAAIRLRLRNYPFQPLAGRTPGLVCALNHALVADGLQAGGITPTLTPRPGE